MAQTNKQSWKKRKGSVMLLALMMVMFLFATGLGLLRLGSNARIQAAKGSAEISARIAADTSITEAVLLMNKKLADELTWDNSTLPEATNVHLPNSYTSYSYTITGNPTDGFLVTSTGKSGVETKIIKAILKTEPSWFGIGVKDTIDVMVGVSFSTDPPGSDFSIRTNSTETDAIMFKMGITIPGDIIVGPGGDPDNVINFKDSTIIEGDTYAAENEIEFPPVIVPDELTSLPLTTYVYQPGVPITGSVKFDTIDIPQAGVQEVVGDSMIYVTGETILGQNAELIVKADPNAGNSSLVLYLGGNLTAGNSTGIDNETGDASLLKIYGTDTCESIELKAKGETTLCYIYAPNATVDVYAKNTLAGAFVSKSFNLKSNTSIVFMPGVWPADIINEASTYLMKRWWEEN